MHAASHAAAAPPSSCLARRGGLVQVVVGLVMVGVVGVVSE